MIDSEYTEIPAGESLLARRKSSPFIRRELLTVLRGRFCFPWGQAFSCLKGTYTLSSGETKSLKLGIPIKGAQIGVEVTHTLTEEVSYELGDCDSVSPVLCYSDSEVAIYECAARLTGYVWKWNEHELFVGGRSRIEGNTIRDDPRCGCQGPARGGPDLGVDQVASAMLWKVMRTFGLAAGQERFEQGEQDPEEVVRAAAIVMEEALAPNVELPVGAGGHFSGVAGVDGEARWLGGVDEQTPSIALVATNCNATLRGKLSVDRERPVPLLGFAKDANAAAARVSVLAAAPGQRELSELISAPAAFLSEQFATVWFEADLSSLPEGSEGYMAIELTDWSGQPTGTEARVPFAVDTEPHAVPLRAVAGA